MYSAQMETQTAAEDDHNADIVWLLEKYWPDARKQIYDYDTEWEKYKNKPKKIVIHHSASEVCNPVAISNYHRTNKKNGTEWRNTSTKTLFPSLHPEEMSYSDIRYHFIIQPNGKIEDVRNEDEVGRWTRTHNIDSLHIMLCGNFDITEPTKEQYAEWGSLISSLRAKYGEMPVYTHWDLEPNSCAGDKLELKKFGLNLQSNNIQAKTDEQIISSAWYIKVKPLSLKTEWCKAKKWMKCLWVFDEITAYYAPVANQGRYFAPDGKNQRSYQTEVKINGDLTPANSMLYIDEHKYTHGACGYNLLGKKLRIDGWSDKHGVFTCVDRGGAVDHNDIDIRYGIGREALNRIDGKDDKAKKEPHVFQAVVYEVI